MPEGVSGIGGGRADAARGPDERLGCDRCRTRTRALRAVPHTLSPRPACSHTQLWIARPASRHFTVDIPVDVGLSGHTHSRQPVNGNGRTARDPGTCTSPAPPTRATRRRGRCDAKRPWAAGWHHSISGTRPAEPRRHHASEFLGYGSDGRRSRLRGAPRGPSDRHRRTARTSAAGVPPQQAAKRFR